MFDEAEAHSERPKVGVRSTIDILQKAPHLTIRNPRTFLAFEETLAALNPQGKIKITETIPEQSMALSSSHIIQVGVNEKTGMPEHTIKLVSPERYSQRAREKDWLTLLAARNIPTGEKGPVSVPSLDVEKSVGLALVMSYEHENLSKHDYVEDFLVRVQDYLTKVRDIKPTEENKKMFAHENPRNLAAPKDSVTESSSRLEILATFTQILEADQVEENLADRENALELLRELKSNNVNERLAAEVDNLMKTQATVLAETIDPETVCIDNGDLSPENFLYRLLGDKSAVSVVDGEYAQFQSQLYSVAYFINHPRFRNLFDNSEAYKTTSKKFLVDYVWRANLNPSQIRQLNTFVATSHLFWEATLAKTIATGRTNFREISGGIFKSRLEAVRRLDVPLLMRMLNEGPIDPISDGDIKTQAPLQEIGNKKDFSVITSPMGNKHPVTRYHRWAGEIFGKKVKSTFEKIKRRFELSGIKPPSRGEMVNNAPYAVGEVENIIPIANNELFLAIQKYDSYYVAQRTGHSKRELQGRYGYLVESEAKREKEGNMLFITADTKVEDNTPQKIPYFVNPKVIETISQKTDVADILCQNLQKMASEPKPGQVEITNVKIIDQNKKYFTIVVLQDQNGHEYPVVLYKSNRKGSAGGTFVIQEGDHYQLVENRRVITRPRENINVDAKSELETFRDWFDDETAIAQETGLKSFQYERTPLANIRHDSTTDLATVNMSVLKKIPQPEWANVAIDSLLPQKEAEDDLETINRGISLSGRECVSSFGTLIRDSMTTVAISLSEMQAGKMRLNKDRSGVNIVMEKAFDIATGEYVYRMPRGPRDVGNEIGNLYQDSGKSRIDRKVSIAKVDGTKLSTTAENIVSFTAVELDQMIRSAKFDDITTAGLIVGMVNQGIYSHN